MARTPTTMRWSTFHDRYEPLTEPSGDSQLWEREALQAANPDLNHVWTVIDCDGTLYVTAGYHVVNRLGYAVTKHPWVTGDEQARW
jgi:hypothetical protein